MLLLPLQAGLAEAANGRGGYRASVDAPMSRVQSALHGAPKARFRQAAEAFANTLREVGEDLRVGAGGEAAPGKWFPDTNT